MRFSHFFACGIYFDCSLYFKIYYFICEGGINSLTKYEHMTKNKTAIDKPLNYGILYENVWECLPVQTLLKD